MVFGVAGNQITVLTTPQGKWVWWPALQTLDYVPRGKRQPAQTVSMSIKDNTEPTVIVKALKLELRNRTAGK